MIDNGSSHNFITYKAAAKLKLPKFKSQSIITGIGNKDITSTQHVTKFTFSSHFQPGSKYTDEAVVIPEIGIQPPSAFNNSLQHLKSLQLADPDFNQPSEVDVLLGSSIFAEIVKPDIIKSSNINEPIAINSTMGWIILGGRNHTQVLHSYTYHTLMHPQVDNLLQAFWSIDTLPMAPKYSSEEQQCEEHFLNTYTRRHDGRFIVRIPFKTPQLELGNSLQMAVRRFQQVERRLQKNRDHCKEYIKFMQTYESMNHMVEVDPPTQGSKFRCYIPHHFVQKEDSTTTKFRVVFDASANTTNNQSLNGIMMVGPTVQDSLFNLLIRFRTHHIVFTADVEKMYRQVLVHQDDQEYQHIIWREEPSLQLKHYRLQTVTYGTAAAPYLATRAISTLADLSINQYPLGARALKEDFYVDDCITGAQTVKEAIETQQQLIHILNTAQMPLRKFASNSEEVLQAVPEQFRELKTLEFTEEQPTIKTLGIVWNPTTDSFGFKTRNLSESKYTSLTKRIVLSEIARLFDPIGWLAPCIISAKILMQSIWKEQIDWDDQVPDYIKEIWTTFKFELPNLEQIKIPRWYFNSSVNREEDCFLIGFCDSSEQAYAAVIYTCSYPKDGNNLVTLVTSKTRVAPLKKMSLPRLELCGALLLAELMESITAALKLQNLRQICYTDSTLVLGWIQSESYKYQTFIANRISKIQSLNPQSSWRHVRGVENPADLPSRGLSPAQLVNNSLWWNGPEWLNSKPLSNESIQSHPEPEDEKKKQITCNKITIKDTTFLNLSSYSKLVRIQRVMAWIRRFISKTKLKIINKPKKEVMQSETLSSKEIHEALHSIIKIVQAQEFNQEIQDLLEKTPLSKKSKLLNLHPFVDNHGILRVGGRLQHSNLPVDVKHPIILPNPHQLTYLILKDVHLKNLHAGPQAMLSFFQQNYWVIGAKWAIKNIIRKCITCIRQRGKTHQQMMASLPSFRTNPASPFKQCGVDYAGPFLIKPDLPRSRVTIKAYIALFICCVTRAIHLEIVSSASTDAFLAAFRRFISRRGKPSHMYSDNGTNFTGAAKEIKEFQQLLTSKAHNQIIANVVSQKGIQWHFNPPYAPHFGGLWEAGVKSTKHHLRRIMGETKLTFEELTTLSSQIEAILNSRPITPESTDPSDFRALTPGHFLIGRPVNMIPEPDLTDEKMTRLSRWQLIQQMTQHFWSRWSGEYISRLQQRPKWLSPTENIEVGAMVILKEDNLPPFKWNLGRIEQVHPGTDGNIRTVTVRTREGLYKRPIIKLCILPNDSL